MDDNTAVRTLIGDQAKAEFTDAEIGLFITLAGVNGPGAEYFFAAAMAMDALCSKYSSNLQEIRIGDFMDSSGRNKVKSLQMAADEFRNLYYNTPAWAIVESNESDLNALIIIRNYVLRTNP